MWYPGAVYHVMSRGNRRDALFKEKEDYLTFLEYLAAAKEDMPFTLHACCLMTNHFHLSLETGEVSLSRIMQKILHNYSRYFNDKYKYTGHVFEKRFTDCLIRNDRYFLEVSRYIHLNPVKAMMVRGPLDYKYSSYRLFVAGEKSAGGSRRRKTDEAERLIRELVDTKRTLAAFGEGARDAWDGRDAWGAWNGQDALDAQNAWDAREQYRMFVESRISHEEHELLIMRDMGENELWLPW